MVCGQPCSGIRAKDDRIILVFRKVRSLLRLPPRHSAVHAEHLAEAQKRREKFESMLEVHKYGAALFFVLFVVGTAIFNGWNPITILSIIPAFLGGLFIYLLVYLRYFPKFE
jgi:hypothetical protein